MKSKNIIHRASNLCGTKYNITTKDVYESYPISLSVQTNYRFHAEEILKMKEFKWI